MTDSPWKKQHLPFGGADGESALGEQRQAPFLLSE